ncbi:MAG: FtsH protease activity modulator HflK [Candidatus Hydrogenedentes bacterium]|nr:FtsH protease activity modulator HflK [Candidatus Hydrogenedentota bacterium]
MAYRKPEVIRSGGEHPFPISPRTIVIAVLVLLLAIWLIRGGPAYTVAPDEEGVVLRFGRYARSEQPGFHVKFPWPIESVETPKVTEIKRLEFGFRSSGQGPSATYVSFMDSGNLLKEAQMLTGDENVVDCSMAIQYQIRLADVRDYLFNFGPNDVEATLRDIGEAALRQAVGDHPIDDVLTTGKLEVQQEIEEKVQELADQYGMGIKITAVKLQDVQPPKQVAAAFKDVATAREEREKIINEALAYKREQIPEAEGQGEALRQEAEGYKAARIAEAQGAVARFKAIALEYDAAPEITRTRLYLEAMNEFLPRVKLTVIDEEAGVVNLKALTGPSSGVVRAPQVGAPQGGVGAPEQSPAAGRGGRGRADR